MDFKTFMEQRQKILDWKEILQMTKNASEPIYVRWSAGPEYDMQEGARSRNAAGGQLEAGLSAQRIDDKYGRRITLMAHMIVEYRFSGNPAAHFYEGEVVGRGGDNEPLIRPTEYLGTISGDVVENISEWRKAVLDWKYKQKREGSAPDLADYIDIPPELEEHSNKIWA